MAIGMGTVIGDIATAGTAVGVIARGTEGGIKNAAFSVLWTESLTAVRLLWAGWGSLGITRISTPFQVVALRNWHLKALIKVREARGAANQVVAHGSYGKS
jgi:hypothetical protein